MNYKEYKQKQKEDLEVYKQKLKANLDEFKEKLKIKLEKFKLKAKAKSKNNKKKSNKRKGGVVSENFLEEFLNRVINYLNDYFCNNDKELNFVQILQEISGEELEYLKGIPISENSNTNTTLYDNFDELFLNKFKTFFNNKLNFYYDIRRSLFESITKYTDIPQEIPKDNTEILISIICKLYYEIYQLEFQGISLSDDKIFQKIYQKLNNDEVNEIKNLNTSDTELLELLIGGVLTSINQKNISVYRESYSDTIKSFIINKKNSFDLNVFSGGLMNVNKLLDLLKDNQYSQIDVGSSSYDPLSMIPNRAPSRQEAQTVMKRALWDRAATGEPLGNQR